MKKIAFAVTIGFCFLAVHSKAQINLDDLKNLKISDLLGKTMSVKKGWAPKFSLNNQNLSKIQQVGQIFGIKNNPTATKLFNTFKTGRTVYRVIEYASAAVSLYGAVKSIDKTVVKKEYQNALSLAAGSALSGVLVKLLTKGAAEKAKNEFNNMVKKKVKDKISDIIGIGAASNGIGVGLIVKIK